MTQPARRSSDFLVPGVGGTNWERGDWMQLYSGARFYPASPEPGDIDIEDIAHALGLICRYGGHVSWFYSVAEHCVLMSQVVPEQDALAALLHDATEAYVGDMVRPLKRMIPEYQRLEGLVWYAICFHFDIPTALPPSVKDADNRILLTERDELMPKTRYSWEQDSTYTPLPVSVVGWSPEFASQMYMDRFKELTR